MRYRRFFPQSKSELLDDLKFLLIPVFVALVFSTMANDIPEIEITRNGVEPVRGECRAWDGVTVCFDTWKILGVDTGVPPSVIEVDDSSFGSLELSKFIFWRESDLVSNKEWPESSSLNPSGNYSGSLPDFSDEVRFVNLSIR